MRYFVEYVLALLHRGKPRRCMRMCGRLLRNGQLFCSDKCRANYTLSLRRTPQ